MVWLAIIFFMLSFAAVTLLGAPILGMLFLGAMLVGKYNSGVSGFFVGLVMIAAFFLSPPGISLILDGIMAAGFLLFSPLYTVGHYLDEKTKLPREKSKVMMSMSKIADKFVKSSVEEEDPTLWDMCKLNPAINIYPELLGITPPSLGFAVGYVLIFLKSCFFFPFMTAAGLLIAASAFYFAKPRALRIPAAIVLHTYTLYILDWKSLLSALTLIAAFKFVIDPIRQILKKST